MITILYTTAILAMWFGWLIRGCTLPEAVGIVDGPELRERVPWDAGLLWVLGLILGALL